MSLKEVLSQCKDYDASKVLDAIRSLVDNDVLQLDKEGNLKRK